MVCIADSKVCHVLVCVCDIYEHAFRNRALFQMFRRTMFHKNIHVYAELTTQEIGMVAFLVLCPKQMTQSLRGCVKMTELKKKKRDCTVVL